MSGSPALSAEDPTAVIKFGWTALGSIINRSLKDNFETQILFDEATWRRQIVSYPNSLYACLWYQLAKACEGKDPSKGKRPFKQCEECGANYAVSEDAGTRSHRRFCSNKCRLRTHRTRKAALQLRAEGLGPAAIAKKLGTDTNKVREWIARSKEKS